MKSVSIGRVVHFVLSSGEHRPALVTNCWDNDTAPLGYANIASLTVFLDMANDVLPPNGLPFIFMTSVQHDEDVKASQTWHWPEVV